MEARKHPRTPVRRRLSTSIGHDFTSSEILDWSKDGIRVTTSVPINPNLNYRVRLHFEKDGGLGAPALRSSLDGLVRWTRLIDGLWHVGLQLDVGEQGLREHFDRSDTYYMVFMEPTVAEA